jgi:hypothetical protein
LATDESAPGVSGEQPTNTDLERSLPATTRMVTTSGAVTLCSAICARSTTTVPSVASGSRPQRSSTSARKSPGAGSIRNRGLPDVTGMWRSLYVRPASLPSRSRWGRTAGTTARRPVLAAATRCVRSTVLGLRRRYAARPALRSSIAPGARSQRRRAPPAARCSRRPAGMPSTAHRRAASGPIAAGPPEHDRCHGGAAFSPSWLARILATQRGNSASRSSSCPPAGDQNLPDRCQTPGNGRKPDDCCGLSSTPLNRLLRIVRLRLTDSTFKRGTARGAGQRFGTAFGSVIAAWPSYEHPRRPTNSAKSMGQIRSGDDGSIWLSLSVAGCEVFAISRPP